MTEQQRPILDRDAFDRLAERHHREIQLHCYRMLGSLHDAEDAAQEAFIRAWRGRAGFEGRASARGWLFRIATNVCLRTLERRRVTSRRILPESLGAAVAFEPLGDAATDIPWLEPYPIAATEFLHSAAAGPEARYETREAVRLAFIAAIQALPPRQRAVLLLRDVVGMTADETAGTLGASVAAANSSLQRARATLRRRYPSGQPVTPPTLDPAQRRLLDRYIRSWEAADIDGFVGLLADEVTWTMPPWRQWYAGRAAVGAFLVWAFRRGADRARLVPTWANGQPAFGLYRLSEDGVWQPFAIQVLALRGAEVISITNFVSRDLFSAFGLPVTPGPRTAPDR